MERWRVIPGFDDYEVNDCGVVRRLTQKKQGKVGQIKSQWASTSGRMNVTLHRDGRSFKRQVHRLVLESFVGPCPAGMECRHLDGNHLNNALDNLAWGTHQANLADRNEHGTSLHGERNPLAKATHCQVVAIREMRRRHPRKRSGVNVFLSRFLGLSISIVSKVGRGRTWTRN